MKTSKLNLKREIKNLQKKIYLKCLECSNCQPKEVIHCEIRGCPLWESRAKKAEGLYILIKRLKQKNLGLYEPKK